MLSLEKLFGPVKAEREPMDTQLILILGADPYAVYHLESFVRLRSWNGRSIDVLIVPNAAPVCLAEECVLCNAGADSACHHVQALQLHGLLPRVPTPPQPEPAPRPIIRPACKCKPVAAEGLQ